MVFCIMIVLICGQCRVVFGLGQFSIRSVVYDALQSLLVLISKVTFPIYWLRFIAVNQLQLNVGHRSESLGAVVLRRFHDAV